MIWPDQSRYEGEFHEGRMEGRGIRYYANGNIHEGEFVNNKPHGSGTFFNAKENLYREATWKEGKIQEFWQLTGATVQTRLENLPLKDNPDDQMNVYQQKA